MQIVHWSINSCAKNTYDIDIILHFKASLFTSITGDSTIGNIEIV